MKPIFSALCLTLALVSANSYAGLLSFLSRDYTRTQHPIVLVHGLYGFDNLLGMDYFYRVPAALERSGAEVYIITVAGTNGTEIRGEQLLEQLETLSASSGHDKFNLVGHSHGSPTARYVASVRPELVASITSIGGTNKGSRTADLMHIIPENSFAEQVVALFATTLGYLIDGVSGGGYEQDAIASFRDLTTASSQAFNERHPQGVPRTACGEGDYLVDGIRYYSWSGTKPLTNALDISDALLGFTSLTFFGEANDGLVSRCSSHLGQVIRDDYRMNHLDETNLILGLHDILSTDPLTLFRQHANRLQRAGL